MRARHRSDHVHDEPAVAAKETSDGLVATASHAAGDIGEGLRDAGEKARDATAKGAHEVADFVRGAAETGGQAAAHATDAASERAHAGAVALRTHRRKLAVSAAAVASGAFAVLAALLARRPSGRGRRGR
jgi:hypothetical protein